MTLAAYIAVEQGGRHYDCVFIFTRLWCPPTLVQSKPSRDFALRHWLPQ